MSKGWQLSKQGPKFWFGGWVDEFVAKSPQNELELLN
jgi:hypothetical protein